MQYLYIFFLILLYTAQAFLCKLFTKTYPGDKAAGPNVFSAVSGYVVALVVLASSGFSFSAQPLTILLAAATGVVLALYDRAFMMASDRGPYAVIMTSVVAGGIIIPMFARMIYAGDRPAWWRYVAVVMILCAAYLVNQKAEDQAERGRGFGLWCLLIAGTNGAYGVLLDLQQIVTGPEEKDELVIGGFLIMAAALTVIALVTRGKKITADLRQTPASALWLGSVSVVKAGAILMLTFLISYMSDTTLLYMFDNAGTMLFSALLAVLWLREKLSPANRAGVALMTAGLVIASI